MSLIERARQWLTRQVEALRSWPIIDELWQRLAPQVMAPARRDELLDYFLSGYSIARSAAYANPGAHGSIIVIQQRQLEERARNYILQLEYDLAELRQAAAQAAGGAAVRARNLDQQIAQLERENRKLRQQQALLQQQARAAQSAAGGVR